MRCNANTHEELIALTSGELGRWRAWRLQRHLARCTDCSSALTVTQTLWDAAYLTHEETVEETLKERLYASVLSTLRKESDSMSELKSMALPGRIKRITFATGLLVALILVTPVVATITYVHYTQEEEQRREIGADWQQAGLLSQQDYLKVRQIIDGIWTSGTISDEDLDWSLNVVKQSPSGIVRARVMGMYTILKQMNPAQKEKIQAMITPLLTSEDKLDRAYAHSVQTVLNKL
jgi:hypothetical protein